MLGMEIAPDSSAHCLGAREAKVACNQICVFMPAAGGKVAALIACLGEQVPSSHTACVELEHI